MASKKEKNKPSTEMLSIIALLNNIDDLIVISNRRKDAAEVMKALAIYARNVGYKIPQEKIDNFHAILIDSRPITLSCVLHDIANDIYGDISDYQ